MSENKKEEVSLIYDSSTLVSGVLEREWRNECLRQLVGFVTHGDNMNLFLETGIKHR